MKLSDKQTEALFKMEEFAGVGSHRENFENREEFQAYWDLLDKKCKKKKNFFKAVDTGKVSLVEIRKKREENILAYYQDYNHLLSYGEKYNQKFLPSSGKLLKQLIAKCKDEKIANQVFVKMLPSLDDKNQIKMIVDKQMRQGKSAYQIRAALSKKLFPKNLIDQALLAMSSKASNNIEESNLESQITKMRNKGKSVREIQQKFHGSFYAKEDINKMIAEATLEKSDEQILEKEIEKLLRKKVDKKKIIQRLMQKGFAYTEIKKFLN